MIIKLFVFITSKQVEKIETSLLETPFKTKSIEPTCINEKNGTSAQIKPENELENFKEESLDEPIEENDLFLKNDVADQKYVEVLKKYFGYNSFRPYVF